MGNEDQIMAGNTPKARLRRPGSPGHTWALVFALSPAVLVAAACGSQFVCAQAPPASTGPAVVVVPPGARPQPAEPALTTIQQTTFEADKLTAPKTDKPSTVKIVARINDRVILDEEVRDAVMPMLLQMPPEERQRYYTMLYNRELQKIIDRELVLMDLTSHFGKNKPQYLAKLKEAAGRDFQKTLNNIKANLKKNGNTVESEDELKKILRAGGLTLEGYRRHHERSFMSMEYLRAMIFPMVRDAIGRQEIVEYYDQHATEFEMIDRVHWQDIYLDVTQYRSKAEAAAFANQLVERARRGEDFAKMAKEYDHGDSKWRGGDGVWSRPGEVQPPELEPLLFRMKAGDVAPVVETASGFHIVRLVERERAGRRPLDDKLQLEIRRKLQMEILERETRRVISELRRKAAIEILDDEATAKSE